MKFSLSETPLRSIFSFNEDNIYEILLPFVKEFLSQVHEEKNTPIPPAAFVLRQDDPSIYLNGYNFVDFESFMAEVVLEAQQSDMVITMTEVGTIDQNYSRGLILLCVQSAKFYCCQVFSLTHTRRYDILEEPLRILIEKEEDPLEKEPCYLVGMFPLIQPIF